MKVPSKESELSHERIRNYGSIIYCNVAREQKLVNTQGQLQVHRLDLQVPFTTSRAHS
jgi:hypothetical protein